MIQNTASLQVYRNDSKNTHVVRPHVASIFLVLQITPACMYLYTESGGSAFGTLSTLESFHLGSCENISHFKMTDKVMRVSRTIPTWDPICSFEDDLFHPTLHIMGCGHICECG